MENYAATLLVVFAAALVALSAPAVEACNGYRLVMKGINTNCADGSPSIFQIKNFGMAMTPDCKFVPRGCANLTQRIESAEVTYLVKTSTGLPIAQGTGVNGCEIMKQAQDNKEAALLMDMFQLPKSCPVDASETCADGKVIDMTPFKDNLTPGSIRMEAVIKHDKGMFSCVNFEGALKK